MPVTPHMETHFTATQTVRDIVIGMADGLTVPFALAAGLAGTVSAANVIVVAGLAEIAAGSIAMGLGGYLAALYASRHPEVEKLVLLAPALNFPERFPLRFTKAEMEQWKRDGHKNFFHYGEKREVELNYGIVEDAAKYPSFPEFAQSALILHGTGDNVVLPSISQRFAETHPNVRLVLLESGHELTDVLEVLWNELGSFCKFQTT
jgi:hypothetical protein